MAIHLTSVTDDVDASISQSPQFNAAKRRSMILGCSPVHFEKTLRWVPPDPRPLKGMDSRYLALVPLSKAHGTSQAGRPHKLLELDLMGSWFRNRSSKQESKENSDLRTSLGLKVTMTTTSFRLASVDDLCAGFVLRRAWKWPPSDTDSQGPQSLPRSRRRRRCRVRCRP